MNLFHYIAIQNNKASKSVGNIISWVVLIEISCFNFLFDALKLKGEFYSFILSAARMWSLNGGANSCFSYFYGIFLMCGIPLLAVLPFSNEILYIRNSHCSQFIFTRMKRTTYYFATIIVAFVRSTIMTFSTLALNQILWLICCPINSSQPLTQKVNIDFEGAYLLIFKSLYFDHPYLYNFLYMILISLLAGILAAFGATLCFVFKKQFQVLLLPFIVYLGESFIVAAIGYYRYSISETLMPVPAVSHLTFGTYVVFTLMMIFVSSILCFYGIVIKKDEFE